MGFFIGERVAVFCYSLMEPPQYWRFTTTIKRVSWETDNFFTGSLVTGGSSPLRALALSMSGGGQWDSGQIRLSEKTKRKSK